MTNQERVVVAPANAQQRTLERANRQKSNQQDLMQEMQPQRQLGRGFVQLLSVMHRGNFKIAGGGNNRGQFQARQG